MTECVNVIISGGDWYSQVN